MDEFDSLLRAHEDAMLLVSTHRDLNAPEYIMDRERAMATRTALRDWVSNVYAGGAP